MRSHILLGFTLLVLTALTTPQHVIARTPTIEPTPPSNPQAYRSTPQALPSIHYQFPINGHPILFLPPPYTLPSYYNTPRVQPSYRYGGGAAPITRPPASRGLPYWGNQQPPGTQDPGPPLDHP